MDDLPTRHVRTLLTETELDELHRIKRKLTRKRRTPVTVEHLLREGAQAVLAHYAGPAELPDDEG